MKKENAVSRFIVRTGALVLCAAAALCIFLGNMPQTVYADDETVYDLSDFIAWMLERDDLTDEMTADLENAQEMLEGYVESEEIILDDEDDAASLTNVMYAVSILQKIDTLRQTDEYFNQVYDMTDLYTNFTMMVGSAYTANVSIYEVAHVSSYSTFASNEGLAWGYTDPTSGWYTEEKAYITQAMEDLGYSVSDLTTTTWSEVNTLAAEYGVIGHYTGLFYGVSASKDTLMGLGYTTEAYLYSKTSSYNACYRTRYSTYEAYTIDEFESYLYEYLMEIYGGSGDCSSEDDASSVSWAFDNTTKTLTISGSGAMADYTAGSAPWYYLAGRIENVVIEDGVTSVGAYAFYYCTRLTCVSFSDTLEEIDSYAFYRCTGLTELMLPDALETIGSYSFYYCTGLTELTFPDALETIGSNAFYYCTALTTLTFSDHLSEIGSYAFASCTSLESVSLPDSLATLGANAFRNCTALSSVYIPSGMTSVGSYPFYACSSLTSVTFAEDISSIPAYLFSNCTSLKSISIPDTVTSIGSYAFYRCSGLTALTLPDSLTTIDTYAFASCTSLESVTLPDSLTALGTYAFRNCTALSSVYIPSVLTSIGTYPFYQCSALTDITLAEGMTAVPTYLFGYCTGITSLDQISIPDTVTSIEAYAFAYCTGFTELTVPDGITQIGNYAFAYCTALENVVLPEGLDTLGNYVFREDTALEQITVQGDIASCGTYPLYKCSSLNAAVFAEGTTSIPSGFFAYCTGLTSLENISVPDTVTAISGSAFYFCTGLTEAAISESITQIGNSAFAYCTAIESVTLSDSLATLGSYAFRSCTALSSVYIPSGMTSVGSYPFYACSSLTSVTFAEDISSIPAYLFSNCTGLKSISIPDTVTSIGNYAFYCCTGLASITVPETVTSVGNYAFYGCTSLTEAVVESSSTSLGTHLFRGCTALMDVSLPEGMTSVKSYMFYGCTALTQIDLPDTLTSVSSYAFYNCTALESITIPESVISISTYAFCNCTALTQAVMAGGVKRIYGYAFCNCTSLESVTFPSTLTTIYAYAFSGCTALTDVYYVGSESTWSSNVTVNDENDAINDAAFHYIISIADASVVLSASSYTYDGSAKTPSVTVTYDGDTLTEGTDYTITYADNTDAGTASVEVTGTGDCISSQTVTFIIEPADLSGAAVTLEETNYTYDGTAKEPSAAASLDGATLVCGSDYTVSYADNTNAGTATVTLTGIGNYTGTVSAEFTIAPASVSEADISLDVSVYTYSGAANTPTPEVTLGEIVLNAGTDYTVSYENNVNVGTATITVAGTGNYTDTAETTFTIEQASVSDAEVSLDYNSVTYSGEACEPAVTLTLNGFALTENTDFTVSYEDNTDAGTAVVTITGTGNCTGTTSASFTIEQASVSGASIVLSASSYTYDGTAKTPAVTVTVGERTLSAGSDYTIAYADNTDAGTGTATVTGMGNYTGTASSSFAIEKASLAEASVTLSSESFTYSGLANEPEAVVIVGGNTLTEGTDYTVSYADNTDAGTAVLTLTGIGNYTGTKTASFTIDQLSLSGASVSLNETIYTYDGSAKTPDVQVTLDGAALTKDVDYTVEYGSNTDAGTATVTIIGTGNYQSTAETTFTIESASVSSAQAVFDEAYAYSGTALTPVPEVTLGETILIYGTDFTVSYSENTAPGTASAVIMGIGNYTGSLEASFLIRMSIADAQVTLSADSYTYDGSAKEPEPAVVIALDDGNTTLVAETDYTISYLNNTDAGTATVRLEGTGDYTGTKDVTFTINPLSLSAADVTLSTSSYTYNGSKKEPTPTVKISLSSGSTTLTKTSNYTVTYSNNTNAGTAYVTVTGTGNYTGWVKKSFTIKQQALSSSRISLAYTSVAYSGSSKTPTVTVNNSAGKKLTKNTDYTLSYSKSTRKAIGKYTITIKGTGNYSGSISKTYKIIPKKMTVKSAKSSSKKKVTVKWTKISGSITKYQISYRVKGTSSWKTKTVSSSKSSYTLSGLKSGKTYQIRIRAYRTVSGTKYYGDWSAIKKVKVK